MLTSMENFTKESVAPDVIDSLPPNLLKLTYSQSLNITPGMTVTPTQVQSEPNVEFDADPAEFYTLIMHDPDAPSRQNPAQGEWQHWLIVNIPGSDVKSGEVLSEYVGSGPPKDTGLHRYIFLVYKQNGKQEFQLPRLPSSTAGGRAKQKVRDVCSNNKLSELVAGNFFLAEWDDYVPKLYAQFKN